MSTALKIHVAYLFYGTKSSYAQNYYNFLSIDSFISLTVLLTKFIFFPLKQKVSQVVPSSLAQRP